MNLIPYKARMTYYRLMRKARGVYDPKPERLQAMVGLAGEFFPVFSPLPRNVKWQRDDRAGRYCEKLCPPETKASKGLVLIFLHGGAFVFGSPKTHRHMVGWLSRELGCEAIIPDYRLSPKNRFPAALDDVEAVYDAVRKERPEARIILAGDSAGGNLVLSLTYRLMERGEKLPEKLLLFSPWIDLREDSAACVQNREKDSLFNKDDMQQYSRLYRKDADPNQPMVSPILGPATGLPPIFLQVAANEFLYPDYEIWVERLKAAGQDLVYDVVPRAFHSWQLFPGYSGQARQSLKKAAKFVKGKVKSMLRQ